MKGSLPDSSAKFCERLATLAFHDHRRQHDYESIASGAKAIMHLKMVIANETCKQSLNENGILYFNQD